jgi:hypothetical protein
MKLQNYKNLVESQGNFMLAWGPSGCGKTSTVLQSAQDPIVLLTAEKRKIQTTIAAINRPDIKLKVGVYENFADCIDTVFDLKRFDGAKTIFLDSLTHLMAAQLSYEILDQDYNSKTEDERNAIIKELTMSVKMSKESYGALADNMLRLMNGLQNLTMAGYDVICTARSEERTRYNKQVAYGPALSGQKFTFAMPGYFDFIACLQSQEHIDKDGNEIPPPAYNAPMAELWGYHAPLASFDSTESYLAKYTGPIPPKGIIKRKFHVKRVFEEANGKFS